MKARCINANINIKNIQFYTRKPLQTRIGPTNLRNCFLNKGERIAGIKCGRCAENNRYAPRSENSSVTSFSYPSFSSGKPRELTVPVEILYKVEENKMNRNSKDLNVRQLFVQKITAN